MGCSNGETKPRASPRTKRVKKKVFDIRAKLDELAGRMEELELSHSEVLISEEWKPARAIIDELVEFEAGACAQVLG